MEKIIDDYFKSEYLTCGKTRDNFIFTNCSREFVEYAKKSLVASENDEVRLCLLAISKQENDLLNKTLETCRENIHKISIARDFICSKILLELIKNDDKNYENFKELDAGVNAILKNDWQAIKQFHMLSPIPYDITTYARKNKFELNIFIEKADKYLQQAINNFISAREPYSVKLFIKNDKLSTYYDQIGSIIQSPHDYMLRDLSKYSESSEESGK